MTLSFSLSPRPKENISVFIINWIHLHGIKSSTIISLSSTPLPKKTLSASYCILNVLFIDKLIVSGRVGRAEETTGYRVVRMMARRPSSNIELIRTSWISTENISCKTEHLLTRFVLSCTVQCPMSITRALAAWYKCIDILPEKNRVENYSL